MGHKLVSGENGRINYNVKIIEYQKLEEDPKYRCTDYKLKGDYASCVEKNIIRDNLQFLNCTPPWMSNNEAIWCRGRYAMNTTTLHKYYVFLKDVSVSQADYGK